MKKTFCLWAFIGLLLIACSDNDDNCTPSSSDDQEVSFEPVLRFFKEINGVPRPSMHEEQIRQYLINFAETRGLRYRNAAGNIIIYKDATAEMTKAPTVVLQTHMDMVCVAAEGYNIDFLTKGIEQEIVDGYIRSKDNKTSLGADNGIGMGIVLAILDSKDISHGPLECLFTWNEEQGMGGASALEAGILTGKYILNIDSEEDGQLLVGTAGSVSINISKTFTPEPAPSGYASFLIHVGDLAGGHSGVMINNGGANANKLIADFLAAETINYRLVSFEGGTVGNAITTSANAVVLVPVDDAEAFSADFDRFTTAAKVKYQDVDLDMSCDSHVIIGTIHCIPDDAASKLISGLAASPQGVLEWSKVVEGIFELSNNIGIVRTEPDNWYVKELPRGFNDEGIVRMAADIAKAFPGTDISFTDRYSPWSPDINGSLIVYAQKVYREIHGSPMQLLIVGGGVEASMFSVTYPDVQIICYGPTILDAHTIWERVEISTIANTWHYTLRLLKQIGELE